MGLIKFNGIGINYYAYTVCTLKLSREKLPEVKSHSMESLKNHFYIDIENNHRAKNDALSVLELYKKL